MSDSNYRRGLDDPLADTKRRNRLASKRSPEAREADKACKAAWDNRLDVRPIIEREMACREK